jgi:hypothetical protein
MCEGWSLEIGMAFHVRWFAEAVAVIRQGGSRRSIHLRSVNFWSGTLRCTASKNY